MPRHLPILCALALCAATPIARATQLLSDPSFEKGFALTHLSTQTPPRADVRLFSKTANEPPVWRLAQWGSRFDLATATPSQKDGGTFYENAGKRVGLLPGSELELAVFAGNEYEKKPRKKGEDWPHLLVEQNMAELPRLNELTALKISFEITIFPSIWRGKEKPNPALHTAQYVMYFTVQNRNRASPEFGDYLWFGVPVYDARHKTIPAYRSADAGKADATGKYIYAPDGARFWKKRLDDGRPNAFAADVLPDMKAAFADAQTKGFLTQSRWEDMSVGAMNTGWEVPGSYDARARLKNLSVEAKR